MPSNITQLALQEQVFSAIDSGAPVAIVESIIEQWPDVVKQTDGEGNLPLHLAVTKSTHDRCAVVQSLLQHWPESIKKKNYSGFHALLTACCCRHMSASRGKVDALMKILVDACPHAIVCSVSEDSGMTPLQYAIADFDLSSVLYMVDQYPEALKIEREGELPLHRALFFRRELELIRGLVSRWPGALKCSNFDRELPLHIAAKYGSTECIRFLTEQWPEALLHRSTDDNLPIHVAITSLSNLDPDRCSSIGFLALQCPDTLTKAGRSGLRPFELALKRQLDTVLDHLLPTDAQSMLHTALDFDETPFAMILKIALRFPQRLRERSVLSGDLPIHTFMHRRKDIEMTPLFLHLWPESAREADSKGRLPLQLAIEYQWPFYTIQMIAAYCPQTVLLAENTGPFAGLYPWQVAAAVEAEVSVIFLLMQPGTIDGWRPEQPKRRMEVDKHLEPSTRRRKH